MYEPDAGVDVHQPPHPALARVQLPYRGHGLTMCVSQCVLQTRAQERTTRTEDHNGGISEGSQ